MQHVHVHTDNHPAPSTRPTYTKPRSVRLTTAYYSDESPIKAR